MSQRPEATFDKPEYNLVPDPQGARMYANVDNQIIRYLNENCDDSVLFPVVVPTGLFSVMRDVFKVDPAEEVTLYLAPDNEFFVFGMTWGESASNVADLWVYTKATLPDFLKIGGAKLKRAPRP